MIIAKFYHFKNKAVNLEMLYPGLYLLKFNNHYDMCMTFLRYQEKYESPNIKFRNKNFTIIDFMEWYSKDRNNNLPYFSYTVDWAGFNIPDLLFKNNWFNEILDKNKYDIFMLHVISEINKDCKKNNLSKYYLIGSVDDNTVNHEVAHGLYYLNKDYKNKMNLLTRKLPKSFVKNINFWLKSAGYTKKVFKDEIQAYMSTGFPENVKLPKNFKSLCKEYKCVYKNFINKN